MEHRAVRTGTDPDGALRFALHGDIDFTNAPGVRQAIEEAVSEAQPETVRIDLADVPFLDSSGVEVLVAAYRLAESLGARCAIEGPSRAVFEHLRMIGLAELFDIAAPGSPATATPQSNPD
jgi:anti-anti-sigma factor